MERARPTEPDPPRSQWKRPSERGLFSIGVPGFFSRPGLGRHPPLLDVRFLEAGANDVAKRRFRYSVHAVNGLGREQSHAGVGGRADPCREECGLRPPATRIFERPGGSEPAERASADPTREGELYAIYVLSEAWGTGVGRAPNTRLLALLRADCFEEAVLWVLDDNPRARRFYELAGWRLDGGVREDTFLDTPVREVRYRIALARASS